MLHSYCCEAELSVQETENYHFYECSHCGKPCDKVKTKQYQGNDDD